MTISNKFFVLVSFEAAILFVSLPTWSQPLPLTRQELSGHVLPEFAEAPLVGDVPGDATIQIAIGLQLKDKELLDKTVQEISDPESDRYRNFLTVDEFANQFGPTDEQYKAVLDFARAKDLATKTYANRLLIDVTGPVSKIDDMLHIKLVSRRRPDGSIFFGPDREPSIDLDVPILHVSGLDNYALPKPHIASVPKFGVGSKNDVLLVNGSGPSGTFGGSDFRAAYAPGVDLRGSGQTVALFESDGFYVNDINSYKKQFDLKVPVQVVLTGQGFVSNNVQSGPPRGGCSPRQPLPAGTPPAGTPDGNNGETALDIEMVMAMAPALQLIYVYEGCVSDIILNTIAAPPADVPRSSQVSASYTFGITPLTPNILASMAITGQTVFMIAGDNRALCPFEVGDSRSLPWVTVVGGTNLTMNGDGASWQSETAVANGGGVETSFPLPNYQDGVATTANSGSTTSRNFPDVSMVATNVFSTFNNGGSGGASGTSIAAPLWAGYMALVNQQAKDEGLQPLGFINPALYGIGKNAKKYAADFHDIQQGSGSVLSPPPACRPTPKSPPEPYTGYRPTPGYDLVTGLGSPNAHLIEDFGLGQPSPPKGCFVSVKACQHLAVYKCDPVKEPYQLYIETRLAHQTPIPPWTVIPATLNVPLGTAFDEPGSEIEFRACTSLENGTKHCTTPITTTPPDVEGCNGVPVKR